MPNDFIITEEEYRARVAREREVLGTRSREEAVKAAASLMLDVGMGDGTGCEIIGNRLISLLAEDN